MEFLAIGVAAGLLAGLFGIGGGVRFWEAFFDRSPHARFETEEMFAPGDRVVVRWRYHWVREGTPGHVRGVDLFKVRDGLVAEKMSDVKG